jgi:starch-binding outer membrane protein, SusD/RagB family
MIKLINNTFVFSLIAGIVIMAGCDVLDLNEDPKSFIAPDNFFNTPTQIESVLAGTMRRSYSNWGGYSYNPAFHRHADQNNGGNLVITQNFAAGVWALHYNNIKDLNHAIAAMVKGRVTGVSATVLDELMGQLKFLRAWNYFQLVRHWGDVPIVTDQTEDYFAALPSRAPVAEVYQLIVSDLTDAIEKLPVSWGTKVGRPAKDAAKGLLAKVHLTMATAPLNDVSNYAKAAALAKEVMDAGNYRLVENINDVFSFATEYGPEMMWSFNANDQHRSTDPRVWSGIHGWGDYSFETYWVDSIYPEQPRKHAYIETRSRDGVPFHETGRWAMGVKKYLYDTWDNFARGITTVNMPIIRYADVLLIFAEAENMSKGGPTQAAVDAINKVINRANGYQPNPAYPLLTTNMSKEDFDKAVIQERSFELCFEYDRWPDMVRKRIIPQVVRKHYLVNFTEADYLFPIPESEMRLNPNMVQNPGY